MKRPLLRHLFLSFVLALSFACVPACASPESTWVDVPPAEQSAQAVRLETFVYKPSGVGPFPLVILSHGSAGGNPRASLPAKQQANYFVRQGYAVLVPMRRGRGKSSGVSREYEDKHCDTMEWAPGLTDAMQDLDAVLAFASTQSFVDSSLIVLAGISRGGLLSVAYAAQGDKRAMVKGVINWVGGWVAQAEDQCPTDFNLLQFKQFGTQVSAPNLWLYGARDLFYGDNAVLSYREIFSQGGAALTFELIDGIPENGHWLPQYRDRWERQATLFLASLRAK